MRVTNQMIFDNASRSASAARERYENATTVASTGQRVVHAEDDPAAAGLIVLHKAQAERADALGKAMGSAVGELDTADNALSGVSSALSRARELTVQMANATYSASQRAGAAQEVDGLIATMVGLLNTRAGGRYVFGGFKDDVPPFDASGNYSGDAGVKQVEVAPGIRLDASVRADVAVKGVGGGVDVLATLQSLSAALKSNSVPGVQGALNGLDAGITQVSFARSGAGSASSVLDVASAATSVQRDDARKSLSSLQDADAVESMTRLAQAEQALNATLTAAAKSFSPSLLDKL